eukprot:TRINITY_DN4063_c0_g2_i2.p1 TRINITY_DN4063_c0_g2~~TRINITY_DN4063_c0_g2_i2.p1  ORF type:complete len:260 (-),score=83.66 TRINITY_DN4063_c0_g2_i2:118-897(-)
MCIRDRSTWEKANDDKDPDLENEVSELRENLQHFEQELEANHNSYSVKIILLGLEIERIHKIRTEYASAVVQLTKELDDADRKIKSLEEEKQTREENGKDGLSMLNQAPDLPSEIEIAKDYTTKDEVERTIAVANDVKRINMKLEKEILELKQLNEEMTVKLEDQFKLLEDAELTNQFRNFALGTEIERLHMIKNEAIDDVIRLENLVDQLENRGNHRLPPYETIQETPVNESRREANNYPSHILSHSDISFESNVNRR